MSNWVSILIAVVFGGIGLSNILIYAPIAVPNIMRGIRGELPIPSGLVIGLLVSLLLMLVTGILASISLRNNKEE